MLKFYTGFEISDQTGNALTEKEMTTLHYDRITSLQVNVKHEEAQTDIRWHISATFFVLTGAAVVVVHSYDVYLNFSLCLSVLFCVFCLAEGSFCSFSRVA